MKIEFNSIGVIHSPYKARAKAPHQGHTSENVSEIEVYEQYAEGLKDIDGFSHLLIFYCFHQSRDYSLIVKTPHDAEPHGVFATRSPNRPNPVAICVVKLISRDGRLLKVKGLDAVNRTPLLDIKPYFPAIDFVWDATMGWAKGKFRPYRKRAKPNDS
jgi:tRNA-Thr(GGU) m(6)t(6)A37 methyltransferase TsaA